jgi:hypothetical protein
MKPLKQAGLYLATIAVAVIAIVAVIQLGDSLPPPEVLAGKQAGAGQAHSTTGSLLQTLQSNLDHPLSHLFIQLLVVIAA